MPTHDRRSPDHPLRRVKDYRPDGTRRRRWSGPERALRLMYRRRPLTVLASTIVAVLLPATIVVAGTQVTTGAPVPEGKKGITPVEWTWTDGSKDTARVFTSSSHGGDAASLPSLRFQLPPGNNSLMSLQFMQDGDWNDEWLTKADTRGKATIPIDPYCQDKSWCDGTYRYRVKLGGDIVGYFDISYWDR